MFKANASIRFETSKPKKEVFELLEEELNTLGATEISERGAVRINGSKNNSFSHDVTIEGTIREKDGKYNVEIDANVKPTIVAWIIALCLFPLGLAVLIMPNNAKGEIQQKANKALDNVKMELK